MKKMPLLIMLALMAISTAGLAKKVVIKVVNYQFTPSSVNVKVGDTILFKWGSGTHTTTSTSVPAGARTWDKPIDVNHKQFRYIIKVAGVYKYYCSIHPSMVGTINATTALTANISNFTVNNSSTKPILNWTTSSNKEVAYFSIQRSTDGNIFTEIAKVNANPSNLYSFKDNSNVNDKYAYYQLVMTDVNDNKQLSPIQMIANKMAGTPVLITSLSPNPVSRPGHLMLQFNADKDGVMLAKLYNQSGLLVKEAKFSAVKGVNNGHFHLGDVPTGTYYIIFTLGDLTEKRTVVMK